jgi:hypothetical protein
MMNNTPSYRPLTEAIERNSLDSVRVELASPTVSARPIGTSRASLAVGIVDSLLVRTAKDSLRHHHGLHLMLAQEQGDFGEGRLIRPYVASSGKPSTQLGRLGLRRWNDADAAFVARRLSGP